MKFKHFLSICVLFLGLALQAANLTHLIVELKDNKTYSFKLADKPVITFNDGDLVVNGDASTSYAISNVKNYHFGDGVASDVKTVSSNELVVSYVNENTINVQNAVANAQVSVFTIAGVVVSNQAADADGAATIQLPSQKGVYIVKVGDKSFKVIRK